MPKPKDDHTHLHVSKKHLISLTFDGWRPRLQLHDKHEGTIKSTLRTLTAIGVLINFFTLPWYLSVPAAIALLVLEQFLERSLFVYTAMYIHPIGFSVEPGRWEAMAYYFPRDGQPAGDLHLPEANGVGLVFNDPDYGVRLFDFLKTWNYGDADDKRNNIRLAFITDEERYHVFLYPSPRRKSARGFFSQIRRTIKRSAPTKQLVEIDVSLVFHKSFDTMAAGYQLGNFVKRQTRTRKLFYLMPVFSSDGRMAISHRDHWIKKWQYTSKTRHELKPEEYEYLLWRRLDL